MDDELALDGGSAATKWQKQHAARKRQKLQKQHRAEAKANKAKALREARADLKRRQAKWLAGWKRKDAAAKAAGLPRPNKNGRPWRIGLEHSQVIDMTGWTFGRLTVIRSAPISLTMRTSQRCRVWVVKCSCGSPEYLVNGTSLRQGNSKSCGCLHRERLAKMHKEKRRRRAALLTAPLSIQIAELRHRVIGGKRIARRYSKLLGAVRAIIVQEELRQGIRRSWRGRALLSRAAKARAHQPKHQAEI